MFYTYAFVDFITYAKLVGGCSTDGSTATFVAAVTIHVWRRFRIVASSAF